MRPRKVKELLPDISSALGIDLAAVEAINTFYYKKVRERLTGLDSINIHLDNLGTFFIKEKALQSEKEKLEAFINTNRQNTMQEYIMYHKNKEKLEKVMNIRSMIDAEYSRRKEVINKRFNNVSDTQDQICA